MINEIKESKYIRNKNGEFVCPNCAVIKQNQNTMFYHMKKHEGKLPYECDICSKDFIQKSSLDLHKLSKHKDDKQNIYKCPYDNCQFESMTKANRRIHTIRKHFTDEVKRIDNDLYCISCKKDFQSSTAFYYHAIDCIHVNDPNKLKIINSIL